MGMGHLWLIWVGNLWLNGWGIYDLRVWIWLKWVGQLRQSKLLFRLEICSKNAGLQGSTLSNHRMTTGFSPLAHYWLLHTVKSDHICHAQYSNYIAATHNITHSPCTSKCTTHPPLSTSLPSTTLLCTQQTQTIFVYLSGGKIAQDVYRDGVKVLWCHFHLVWLVLWGFHSYVCLFSWRKTFCDLWW